MFQRDIISKLELWVDKANRKPLVLRGARQVGKTTAVNLFAKNFDRYIYLNMDLEDDKALFEQGFTVFELYEAILLHKRMATREGKTLIFIDEIQNSPKAVAILRYFYEEMPHLCLIAAGSLLETLIDTQVSFPVGRVEYMVIRPCSFSEYLTALREENARKLLDTFPFPNYGHEILMKHFKIYALIGGMPEIIKRYSSGDQIADLSSIYESLLSSYADDVEKYARNETLKNVIRHVIQHSFYSAGERIAFQGFGQSKYKNREMGEAFSTLEKAFFLYLAYPVTSVTIPMEPNQRRAPKLQLLDTGLVNFSLGIQSEIFNAKNLSDAYRGRIAEHVVAQELLSLNDSVLYKLNYWTREDTGSMAEIDWVVQHKGYVIPIEVKSGPTGKLRSLHQFIDRAPHHCAVRVNAGPLAVTEEKTIKGKSYKLLNLPFYLVNKLPEYLNEMVS